MATYPLKDYRLDIMSLHPYNNDSSLLNYTKVQLHYHDVDPSCPQKKKEDKVNCIVNKILSSPYYCKLSSYGFIREFEIKYKIFIPLSINKLINSFFCLTKKQKENLLEKCKYRNEEDEDRNPYQDFFLLSLKTGVVEAALRIISLQKIDVVKTQFLIQFLCTKFASKEIFQTTIKKITATLNKNETKFHAYEYYIKDLLCKEDLTKKEFEEIIYLSIFGIKLDLRDIESNYKGIFIKALSHCTFCSEKIFNQCVDLYTQICKKSIYFVDEDVITVILNHKFCSEKIFNQTAGLYIQVCKEDYCYVNEDVTTIILRHNLCSQQIFNQAASFQFMGIDYNSTSSVNRV